MNFQLKILTAALFFQVSALFAQADLIDSLKSALKRSKHDTARAMYCNSLGENSYLQKPEEALLYFQKAQAICKHNLRSCRSGSHESMAFKKQLAFAINNIGFCAKMQGHIFKAMQAYNSSLKLQEEIGNKDGIATALLNLGVIYNDQGDIPKALDCLGKSLKLHEETKDKKGTATALDDIGVIYFRQGDLTTALMYYTKAKNLREEIHEMGGLATSLNNIGVVYRNQHNTEKAIEFYSRSLKIMEEVGDKQGVATCYNNIGSVYKNELEYKGIKEATQKAIEYYFKGLKIREEIGDKKGIAISLQNIGSVYLRAKEFSKAIEYGERSMKISKELGYPQDVRSSARLLYESYKYLNDHKNALHYYELYIVMRDSITNQASRKASIKTVLKYEYEKQAAADSVAHAKESEIKNEELRRQSAEISAKKNQQYALFGGLFLVCLFGIFMFNRFKVTQKQKEIIESQKSEVEIQKQIVDLKQKEILDSIHYAKRIQLALMPSEKRISQILNKKQHHEG